MNPVENPLTQLMQAFGAAPIDATVGAFGANSATAEADTSIIAQFSGYIEGMDPALGAASSAAFAGLAKAPSQVMHGVPTDASIAVNPATASRSSDNIAVSTLSVSPSAIQALLANDVGSDFITPETAADFSLAANYHTAAPIVLTPADLQTLHSSAPALYATLSASPAAATNLDMGGAITPQPLAQQETQQVPGQFLPASDLKALFAENPTLLSDAASGDASVLTAQGTRIADKFGISPTAGYSTKPIENIVTPAATGGVSGAQTTISVGDTPLGASASVTQSQVDPLGNKSAAFENGAEASGANSTAAKVQAQATHQNAEPELDADGQILGVTQKTSKPTSSIVATATQTASKMAQPQAQDAGSLLQTTAAHGAASSQLNGSAKRGAENLADSLDDKTAKAKASEAPAGMPNNMAKDLPRGSFDWTSPWITPERATGWPDGFATSLVSTGLGGLMGNQSGLSGMSMMGGQASATLGGHVTKQLNLNMTRAVKAGEQEFSMRMDPPELGRVSVKLRFGQNGLVKSQIMAERPETLEMLQREIRGLERAIEAGGHKSEQGGISFSLDSGGQESAGKAFAEAMHQDRLQEEIDGRANQQGDDDLGDGDEIETAIDLDDILAHVTPETGLDVQV